MTKASYKRSTIWTLSFLPILMVLGNSALIPLLPVVQKAYRVTDVQTSLLITTFSLTAGFAIPVIGIAADRYGRKIVILLGLVLFGLGSLWAAVGALWKLPFSSLLFARALQGLGGAATSPIAMVMAGDLFQGTNRTKAMGILESANAFGKVLSPFLGTMIGMLSWIALFFFFPILALPLFLLAIRSLPKVKPEEKQSFQEYKKQILKAFRVQGRWLWLVYLLGALVLFLFFGYYAKMSDQWDPVQIPFWQKGLILTLPLVFQCTAAYITGRQIKKGISCLKKFIYFGLLSIGIGSTIVFFFGFTPILSLSALCLFGLGLGMVLPCLNVLITSAIHKSERGIITSLYHSVRFLGVAFGPPTLSLLGNQRYFHLVVLLVLLLLIWLTKRQIHSPQRIHGSNDQYRILIRKEKLHIREKLSPS